MFSAFDTKGWECYSRYWNNCLKWITPKTNLTWTNRIDNFHNAEIMRVIFPVLTHYVLLSIMHDGFHINNFRRTFNYSLTISHIVTMGHISSFKNQYYWNYQSQYGMAIWSYSQCNVLHMYRYKLSLRNKWVTPLDLVAMATRVGMSTYGFEEFCKTRELVGYACLSMM